MKVAIISINAKNVHKAVAPWCLKAYAEREGFDGEIEVIEANVNEQIGEVVGRIYNSKPDVAAFGCYIWNIEYVQKVVEMVRKLLPKVTVVFGGPEMTGSEEKDKFADYIIQGAGEEPFFELLMSLKNILSEDCLADAIIRHQPNGSRGGTLTPESAKKDLLCNFDCVRAAKNRPYGSAHIRHCIVHETAPIIWQCHAEAGCFSFADYPTPYTDDYFKSFATDQISDIANRLIYYESTRGCPFSCSYCLSGNGVVGTGVLDRLQSMSNAKKPKSQLPRAVEDSRLYETNIASTRTPVTCISLTRVKRDLVMFIAHGAKCVKFVDRTFNADRVRAKEILKFAGELDTDCVFHFEVAADLFDTELLNVISKLPHGRVQFEIGIQSTNPKTLAAIDRKTDISLALKNIKKLTGFGNCHIHVDLIAALPHETIESFAKGFDKCIEARPHHLQLGFLKLLKSTKLRAEADKYGIVYADFPPYEAYKTKTMSYDDILRLKKVEGVVKRFWNRGGFRAVIEQGIDKVGSALVFFYGLASYIESQNKYGGGADVRISVRNAEIVLEEYVKELGTRN